MGKRWTYYFTLTVAIYLIASCAYYSQASNLIYNNNETYNNTSASLSQHSNAKIISSPVFTENKNQTLTYNSFKRWLEDTHTQIIISALGFSLSAIAFFTRRQFYTSRKYLFSLSLRTHSLRGPPAFLGTMTK